jgi:hypothetical protein
MDLRSALLMAETLGPFSAIGLRREPGWHQISELLDDPAVVTSRMQSTRAALARNALVSLDRVDERVAASIMQLGLAARLMAPALATAALGGWVPDLDPAALWWLPETSNPVPLAFPEPRGVHVTELSELVASFQSLVVEQLIGPLVSAVVAAVPMSEAVLWGNVWSGLVGGLAPIAAARPELVDSARTIVTAVLAANHPRYPGTFVGTQGYRRATCCLLYRVPGGGVCGDCVLAGRRTST